MKKVKNYLFPIIIFLCLQTACMSGRQKIEDVSFGDTLLKEGIQEYCQKNEIIYTDELTEIDGNIIWGSDQKYITSLQGLEKFTSLEFLFIYGSEISDLSPLQNCKNLKYLGISDSKVQKLDAIKNLENLEILSLKNNPVSDISPVAGLKNLREIVLSSTLVSDVSPLLSLEKLEVVSLFSLNISRPLIDKLTKKFPGIVIAPQNY